MLYAFQSAYRIGLISWQIDKKQFWFVYYMTMAYYFLKKYEASYKSLEEIAGETSAFKVIWAIWVFL